MKIKGEHREENIEESKLPLQLEESIDEKKKRQRDPRKSEDLGDSIWQSREWRSPRGGSFEKRGEKNKRKETAALHSRYHGPGKRIKKRTKKHRKEGRKKREKNIEGRNGGEQKPAFGLA
ncbi:hypothetical protein ACFX15_042913 [Malus domestica]